MSPRVFRTLIVSTWLLYIADFVLGLKTQQLLPRELQAYLVKQEQSDMHLVEALFFVLIFLLAVVSSVGLFRFRPWSRVAYCWSVALGTVLIGMTPVVEHGVNAAVSYLATLMDGLILVLIYTPPMAELFVKPNERSQSRASKL